MNTLKYISLILVSFFYSCQNLKKENTEIQLVKINNDTLTISVDTLSTILNNSLLRTAVESDKYFYAIIETKKTNEIALKKVLKMSINSSGVEEIKFPDMLQKEILYNFYSKDDSLFLSGEGYNKNFFLDKNLEFAPTMKREFRLFENTDYEVYSNCNGEWGGEVVFKSKKENINHKINISCPSAINNLKNWYYFTMQDIEQNKFYIYKGSISSISEIVEPELLYESPESFISTSFVLNEQLVHLYSKNDSTYLGVLEGDKLVPKYTFQSMFDAKLNQQENGSQVLNCYFPKTKKSGILTIEKSEMKFYIFR